MGTRVVTCRCGQQMRVPEEALGKSGACVRCRNRIEITVYNTYPLLDDEPVSPRPVDKNHCVRCGRLFRGAWDQHKAVEGLVCDICERQCPLPGMATPKAVPLGPVEEEAWLNPAPRSTEDYVLAAALAASPWEQFKERWADFRASKWFGPVLFGVGAAFLMAFVLLFPVEEYAARFFSVAPPENPGSAKGLAIAIIVVRQILSMAKYFTMLYLVLAWMNKLPNDTFGKNFVALGVVVVLMYAIGSIPSLLPLFLGNDYLGAGAVGVSSFAAMAVNFYIVYSLYDLDFSMIFRFFVLGFFITPLFWAIERLIYGIMAAILL